MVSLLHLAEVTEEGVRFSSPVDGARMLLTPEHSIAVQNRLGKGLPDDFGCCWLHAPCCALRGIALQVLTSSWPWMMWSPA